jgi:NAD(P)-dependent dehydrogenase (short-subunit alcohol dehydrogenase family)
MLTDKIIIVTGGSGLLGKEFLKDIKSNGGTAINFDFQVETNLQAGNVQCDITSTDSVDAAIQLIIDKYERIDGLVNNAYPRTKDWGTDFMSEPMESWNKNMEDQLGSHVYITKEVCRQMKNQNDGYVVNIASIYGVVGNDMSLYVGTPLKTVAAYSAIKGALINFTRYLSSYLGNDNIKVNCVSPGGIFDNQDEKFVKRYTDKTPLGRMGTPEDIAPMVSFLLSSKAKYITGQNIIVDGGWTAV